MNNICTTKKLKKTRGKHQLLSSSLSLILDFSGVLIHLKCMIQRRFVILIEPAKADPAPARRAPPPIWNFWGFVFVHFGCITRNNINCCRHTMLTICTLFSTLTTKHRVCVKGASKETSAPRILPRRDRAPRFWNS